MKRMKLVIGLAFMAAVSMLFIAATSWTSYPRIDYPSMSSDWTLLLGSSSLGTNKQWALTNFFYQVRTNAQAGMQVQSDNLDLWSDIVPSTKQDHSANLDLWAAVVPSSFQFTNANLTSWGALATSAKQDASVNLTSWSAIAPSAKQDASANLTSWSALAPSAKQDHSANLDTWSGRTIDGTTITDTAGVLSAVTGGGGNVTGTSPSTSGHLAKFNNGTATGIDDAALIASTVITNNDNRAITLNGGLNIPGATPANTNGAMSRSNVVSYVEENFQPLGDWIPATGTYLMALTADGTSTNPTPVGFGDNVTVVDGNLHATISGGGGSVNGMVSSNYLVEVTNQFIWDLSQAQHLTLQFNTNLNNLKLTNVWYLTNGEAQLDTWEDTNGTWRILSTNVDKGLFRKIGSNWRGTNASQYDLAVLRLDGTGTNVLMRFDPTNIQPVISFTNTMTAGGGGGGGSGSWTLVGSKSSTGVDSTDNTTTGFDSTGANLLAACLTYTGGTVPTLTDSKGNTWTTGLSSTLSGGNPKSVWYYNNTSPTVGAGHTFTVGAVSGAICNIHVYAFTKSGGTPAYQTGLDGETTTANWAGGAGVKPGSITPGNANSLFLTAVVFDVAATSIAVDSSFTIPNPVCSPPGPGIQTAYKIKSADSTAEDPNWTAGTGNADGFANQVVFN